MQSIDARAHRVHEFRQMLWLPLRFKAGWRVEALQSESVPHWRPARSLARAAAWRPDDAYSAQLYFHPYIRNLLFGPLDAPDAPMRLWALAKPESLQALDVWLTAGISNNLAESYVLHYGVERCLLYTFEAGVAMLEVELRWRDTSVAAGEPGARELNLAQVLDALDFVRRTHPPYFVKPQAGEFEGVALGGRYPLRAAFRAGHAPSLSVPAAITAADRSHWAEWQRGLQQPLGEPAEVTPDSPLDAHWRQILGDTLSANSVQIEDERMPQWSYLRVADPTAISRGDWVRLAYADYRGDSNGYPYAAEFVADFEREACYDRYFGGPFNTTRYLNVGYCACVVGAEADGFFKDDLLKHYRQQYACMGLLAQFNKAALLAYSNRLSEASSRIRPSRRQDRHHRQTLRELMDFTHRHWFTGVTNQLQGSELYERWHRALQLQPLYEAVMAEAKSAHELLVVEAEAEQTRIVSQLTKGALVAAAWGVLLAAVSAGFPVDAPLNLPKLWSAVCVACTPNADAALRLATVLVVALYSVFAGSYLWQVWKEVNQAGAGR